jgi:hypothetical protein
LIEPAIAVQSWGRVATSAQDFMLDVFSSRNDETFRRDHNPVGMRHHFPGLLWPSMILTYANCGF